MTHPPDSASSSETPAKQPVPDVFLSYSERDQKAAAELVRRLEAAGLVVWWDRKIPAGSDYKTYIFSRLQAAKCVVALFSEQALSSRWVGDETERAAKRGTLIPVLLTDVDLPLGIGGIQAIKLFEDGEYGLERLVAQVRARVLASDGAANELLPAVEVGALRQNRLQGLVLPAAAGLLPLLALAALATVSSSLRIEIDVESTKCGFKLVDKRSLFPETARVSELLAGPLDGVLLGPGLAPLKAERALLESLPEGNEATWLEVEPLLLEPGTELLVEREAGPGGYRLGWRGTRPALRVGVRGKAKISTPSLEHRLDDGYVVLEPGQTTTFEQSRLHLTLHDLPLLALENGKVEGLHFWSDVKTRGQVASDEVVWEVDSGTVTAWAPFKKQYELGEADRLQLRNPRGTISLLKLRAKTISVKWQGTANELRLRGEEVTPPSVLESLWVRHPVILSLAGVFWLALTAWTVVVRHPE